MTRRARGTVATLVAGMVLLTGCTGLPEEGPVVDAAARSSVDDERPSGINAVPPTPGMSATAVVDGFLDVMTSSPFRVDVAQQFLTTSAAAAWEPAAGTITYFKNGQPGATSRSEVTVELVDAERLDRTGAYVGRLSGSEKTLRLRIEVEDGEFRIADPPDALVVPRGWFTQRYEQASLYYFDLSGRILVPQPVYVPRGEQYAANLVARLLEGPDRDLGRVVRSYLPAGLEPRAAVTVSIDGIAEIELGGEGREPTPIAEAASERLLAQLAWTLRQQPGIRGLRVRIAGTVLRGPDGSEVYGLDEADRYDPNGADPSTELYAIRDRRLLVRDGNELQPVRGPFGNGVSPVRAATPNIDGTRAAGIGLQGRSLLVADLADPSEIEDGTSDGTGGSGGSSGPGPTDVEPRAAFVLRGTDLLPPAWDFTDRIWVVDRADGRARVHVVVDGEEREVVVPGVSQRDVRSFVVSHDGTRFIAVVRGAETDEIRVGRVEVDDLGAVVRVRSTQLIELEPDVPIRVDDITWTSPTTVALLAPLGTDGLYEVRTIGVDGSPSSRESSLTPVSGPVIGLAGTPVGGLPTYVVTSDTFIDLTNGRSYGFVGEPATSIGYAG